MFNAQGFMKLRTRLRTVNMKVGGRATASRCTRQQHGQLSRQETSKSQNPAPGPTLFRVSKTTVWKPAVGQAVRS